MSKSTNVSFSELRHWLLGAIARLTQQDAACIDPTRRFVNLGLDSSKAVALVAALAKELERELPVTIVWDHPTPNALVTYLTSARAQAPATSGPARSTTAPPSRRASEPGRLREPVAVVGVAGRFPGAESPRALWARLRAADDLIVDLPLARGPLEGHVRGTPAAPGGYLPRIDAFDPAFFGIARAEAVHMDPQQRLLLELAWELFQDAGVDPEMLHGSAMGVFVGAMWNDYARLPRSGEHIRPQTALGLDLGTLSARLSYSFGLHGLSMTINTACSSSLVAVHLACAAIERGEASAAIAGGVNLIIGPESTLLMTRFGAMAPDSRCKAFDARANGYVRGEGAGLVLLMPLSQAILGGHHIYCLVRGSAVNNDGASNGMTAPNPGAQVEVLGKAYANAGIEPASVDYVEAHGTGTLLGDPIEARALAAALTTERTPERALRIGSIKTNIGHLESAAGIAGLIKVAMALDRRRLPPSRNFEIPSPLIPFESLKLRVQTVDEAWPAVPGAPARAGISGFGFGGTNCHLALESFEDDARLIEIAGGDRAAVVSELGRRLGLDAPTLHALADMESSPEDDSAVKDSSGEETGRSGSTTLAFCARHFADVEMAHARLVAGDAPAEPLIGQNERAGTPLVFIFSGQGGQWLGMARGLLRSSPAFRAELSRCRDCLREHVRWDLFAELLQPSDEHFADIAILQPMLFSYQVAMWALLRAEGFHPDVVIGHSMGEIAAAYAAGLLTLEDAIRVIARRSALMARAPGDGAMLVIDASEEEAMALATRWPGISIAALNAARSVVLSGERRTLEAMLERDLRQRSAPAAGAEVERRARWINVRVASHSPQMDSVLPELERELTGLRPRAEGVLPMISTLLGRQLDVPVGARYWCDNLRRPVQFRRALHHVLGTHARPTLLEISPHPVLREVIEGELPPSTGAQVAHVGVRDEPETVTLYETLALLTRQGMRRRVTAESAASGPRVIAISAHEASALAPTIEAIERDLARLGSLDDIAHTLGVRSAHQHYRVAVVVDSKRELARKLSLLRRSPSTLAGPRGTRPPRAVFVYSGQGSQWARMGIELGRAQPAFLRDFESTLETISRYVGADLLSCVSAPRATSSIDDTFYSQPAIFAFQVALTRLMQRSGVAPEAVMGHSLGEISAAWASGILSLDDACRVLAVRALVLQRTTGSGRMLAVRASLAEVEQALLEMGLAAWLDVAAVNAPRDIVLAGADAAIARASAGFRDRGITTVQPRVTSPFHSRWLEPFADEIASLCDHIGGRSPVIPMLSTVDAKLVGESGLPGAYWGRNVRQRVRLAEATVQLAEQGYDCFVEIGPHPVLAASLSETLAGRECRIIPTATRQRPVSSPLSALAALYTTGASLDWREVIGGEGRAVPMPPPAWQRESLWLPPSSSVPAVESAPHPLASVVSDPSRLEPAPPPLDWSVLGRPALARELRAIFAGVVESGVERIDFQRSFFDLGLDSAMAVAFAERISQASGLTLNASMIFEYDDLESLIDYLVRRLRKPLEHRLAG
jgi:acyl transferase domain-containing protein